MNRIIFLLLVTISLQSFSQNPNYIKWEKTYGNHDDDQYRQSLLTSDGNILLGSKRRCSDTKNTDLFLIMTDSLGNSLWEKTFGCNGNYWIKTMINTPDEGYLIGVQFSCSQESGMELLKLDSNGNVVWRNIYGGSIIENIVNIKITPRGSYLLNCWTMSNDGDVNSGNKGSGDIWLVEIDQNGNIIKEKTFGGSKNEESTYIEILDNGNILICGYTWSDDCDIQSGLNGTVDYWVFVIDEFWEIIWENTYGGSRGSFLCDILPTNDGGYLLGGNTSVFEERNGISDWSNDYYYIVNIDKDGKLLWEKTYGGSHSEMFRFFHKTDDGNYFLCGSTQSNDGDIQSGLHGTPNGKYDIWIVKIDNDGNIIWEKTYGGTSNEGICYLNNTMDGKYLIGGTTGSNDGDVKSGNYGEEDYWVFEINQDGSIIWEKTYGGSRSEGLGNILGSGNNFLLVGDTKSYDGDIRSGYSGGFDIWVVNIGKDSPPSDIIISNTSINENIPLLSFIGVLSTKDEYEDIHSYSLVVGEGDSDNNKFYISNDSLFNQTVIDFEKQSHYTILVQTKDTLNRTFEKQMILYVINLNDVRITDSILISPYCSEYQTGSISIEIDNYISPLFFLWSNGDTTQNPSNLPIGIYSVSIVDGDSMILTEEFNLPVKSIFKGSNVCFITSDGQSNVIHIDKGLNNYNVEKYVLYREGVSQNEYEKIGEIVLTEDYFVDSLINNRTQSFSYKVSMIDSCGNESPMSSNHNTIHLSQNRGTSGEVNLSWTHYVGLSIPSYSIYRQKEDEEFEILKQIFSNNNTYSDFTSNPSFNYQYFISFQLEDTCYTEVNLKSGQNIEVKSNTVSTDNTWTGVDELIDSEYRIYPNPVNDKLTIETNNSHKVEVRIFDVNGNQIMKPEEVYNKGEINLQGISSGIYLVKLMEDNTVVHQQKIVKY